MNIQKNWQGYVITVLTIALFVLSLNYIYQFGQRKETIFIQQLVNENIQLRELITRTTQLVEKSENEQIIQAFNNVGYKIQMPIKKTKEITK